MTAALAANGAIPVGYRKKATDALPADLSGHAAGVLFVAPDGDVLLLRRSATEKNFGGHWALPGGGVEAGETPDGGASREVKEETGFDASPESFRPLDRRITPTGMAFHTFAQPVSEKFVPKLNDEHSGYCWSGMDMLPRPIHPAVETMLGEQVGIGADMSPEDWAGLRDGFLKWISEEKDEGEHAEDCVTDSALRLALDRDPSVQKFDRDGRLHVDEANVCMECVSPYRGKEIPGWDAQAQTHALGLDPERVYQMYRPGNEIKKAAESMNGIPLMREHIPTTAKDHKYWETIGATGTTARWDSPFLKNGLSIWPEKDIDLVKSKRKYALSPGYHYKPVMESGSFDGHHYDGKMLDIHFNHLCVVEDGRQGDDVVIGDTADEILWTLIERAILEMT